MEVNGRAQIFEQLGGGLLDMLIKASIAVAFVLLVKAAFKRKPPQKPLTIKRMMQIGAGN